MAVRWRDDDVVGQLLHGREEPYLVQVDESGGVSDDEGDHAVLGCRIACSISCRGQWRYAAARYRPEQLLAVPTPHQVFEPTRPFQGAQAAARWSRLRLVLQPALCMKEIP